MPAKFHTENSICAIRVCGYVAVMNWQEILPLIIVLGVAAIFVWRSSSPDKHEHGCDCDCHHDHSEKSKPETPGR
jgi:hypothetical protein